MAALVKHLPGVLTVIDIDLNSSVNEDGYVDFNLKRTLKLLTGGQRSASTSSNVGKSPYDNIIEALERKYSGGIVTNLDNNSAAGDHSSIAGDEPDTLVEKSGKTKKTKKNGDAYDMDDPFIDDADHMHQVNFELKTKKVKTKYDGFFVSLGKLELVPVPSRIKPKDDRQNDPKFIPDHQGPPSNTIQEEAAPTAKQLVTVAVGSASATANQSVSSQPHQKSSKPPLMPADGTTKPPPIEVDNRRKSKGNVGSSNCVGGINTHLKSKESVKVSNIGSGDGPNLSQAASEDIPTESPQSPGTRQSPKPRPQWTPSTEAQQAIEAFRGTIATAGLTIKQALPPQLETSFFNMDKVVRQYHNEKELKKTTGYMETVCDILGGGISAGSLRSLAKRLEVRAAATAARIRLDDSLALLTREIKANIVAMPQPPATTGEPSLLVPTPSLESDVGAGSVEGAAPSGAAIVSAVDSAAQVSSVVFKWTCR